MQIIDPSAPCASYAAFLGGINVGGKKQINMDELRNAFQSWSFNNVATILASGNIIFDAQITDPDIVREIITKGIINKFGFEPGVFIRSFAELKALSAEDPFAGIAESEKTIRYITFLNQEQSPKLTIPFHSSGNELQILQMTGREIFSVVKLTPRYGSIEMMTFLEKTFGNDLTTRNWNTILKILGLYKKNHD